jgi:fucose 4-O-acetylase-like acetyltransferase
MKSALRRIRRFPKSTFAWVGLFANNGSHQNLYVQLVRENYDVIVVPFLIRTLDYRIYQNVLINIDNCFYSDVVSLNSGNQIRARLSHFRLFHVSREITRIDLKTISFYQFVEN